MLVLPHLDLPRLDAFEPGQDGLFGTHADAHRQRVDEDADHRFDAVKLRGPAGRGGPEEHVALAAVAAQEQRPDALHQRVRRQPVLARELDERSRRLCGEGQPLFRIALPGAAAVERQRRRRLKARERLPPELLGARRVLPLEPADVLAEGSRPRQLQLPALAEGHVERQHLFEEQRLRPAVHDEVVVAPDEVVRVVADADEREPHQRRLREVEAPLLLRAVELLQARGQLFRREPAPVVPLDLDGDTLVGHLHRALDLLPEEGGAQDQVALDHALPRRLERFRVETAAQRAAQLAEVDVRLGRVQSVEEHALLHRGQGVDVYDVLGAHVMASVPAG